TKQRILVVEESATLRYMLGKTIQKQGYELLSVDSFSSAIETLDTGSQNLHGILVGWPNYEHFEYSKELLVLLDREPYSEVPVILLSNDAELDLLNWMSTRKATALIPWENYQEVVASLQTMLSPSVEPVIEQRKELRSQVPTRVLFVDDSKSIRVYYQRLLERNHYEVVTAASVNDAYEIATSQHIDIAIVDYFMPGENGYVLCQRLRDNPETSDIRTAVITGTYLDAVITDCLQAGAIECMFKNEAEELFLARIAAMRCFIEVQRSIEKQRENLAAILESVGEGVYGVDKKGRITFMNPAALTVLGLHDVTTVLGKQATDIFHLNKADFRSLDCLKEAYTSGEKLKGWETVFRHQNGKKIPVDCTLHPLYVDDALEGSVIAFRDISDRKLLEEKLRWQATHDHLTGLYNRRYFENYLENEISRVQRSGIMSAVVYMDLDRFKYVNDTAGHEVGDRLLIDLSQSLSRHLRRHDIAARIGGDEFAIILKNVDAELAVKLADEVRTALSCLRVHYEDDCYHVNASFGVAMMDDATISA
ncbi:MAG TPA: diguanylate cyclase, partial [Thiotrichales bacterium]|nr:diguanylate cyclase [Thiotrichales bacterium]